MSALLIFICASQCQLYEFITDSRSTRVGRKERKISDLASVDFSADLSSGAESDRFPCFAKKEEKVRLKALIGRGAEEVWASGRILWSRNFVHWR